MTNQEKYKNAKERERAFSQFCSDSNVALQGDCRTFELFFETGELPQDGISSEEEMGNESR